MKPCSYCGRENDATVVACRECGTEFTSREQAATPRPFTRRTFLVAASFALVLFGAAIVIMPPLIWIVPVLAIFYAPIYLPFVLSFAIRSHEWRGMRWSLRIGSAAALFMWLVAMSCRPDFGSDVAGSIAGASHNLAWTWGSGAICALLAVVIGFLLHDKQVSQRP